MKALIFGANSQDGFYLSEICKARGFEVTSVSRSEGEWLSGDVGDEKFVFELIRQVQPDLIFHLAAISTTRHVAVLENNRTIAIGTLNILEAVKTHASNARVFITGSGVQFVNNGDKIKETDPFEASSAYSVARIHSVYAARYYRQLGVKAYVGYLFHHESPLRKQGHLARTIVEKVRAISNGEQDELIIGDTTVSKEWGYARDIAEGILHLVLQDGVFEATIGTGVAYSIEDWAKLCFNYYGLDYKKYLRQSTEKFEPEYKILVSDPSTMNSLGWKATTTIEELAIMMMQH